MNLGDIHFLSRRLRERALAASIPALLIPPLIPSELAVLDHLSHHLDGARVGDIARGSLLAQSRVSTVVARLKKRGWITTHVPSEDARSTVVALCPEVISGIRSFLRRDASPLVDQMLSGATQSERSAAARGLAILIRQLRRTEQASVPTLASEMTGPS